MKTAFGPVSLAFLLLASIACTRVNTHQPGEDTPTPTPSPTPTATPSPSDDAATFQKILDGEISAAEGMAIIEMSNGWPIRVDDETIFARLDDGRGPYSLAGDHNAWSVDAMTNEAGLWWIQVTISAPIDSKYKFVTGAADYEPDPLARRYTYDQYGEISVVRGSGSYLERYQGLADPSVTDRTVRVWVPAQAPTHHLYAHDGQNLFDPNGPFGGWHLQDNLSPTTLVIGIDNTSERTYDYTHVQDEFNGSPAGGGGDAYADYVELVVRPFIEERYGTPDKVGVMGSSLGGLISFHEANRFPNRYDFAASLSGTFRWGSFNVNNETMLARYQAAGRQSTVLYLDSGGNPGTGCVDSDGDGLNDDDTDTDSYCVNRQFADQLEAMGYVYGEDLTHWHEPGAQHNEAAWAARVFRPIQIFESL